MENKISLTNKNQHKRCVLAWDDVVREVLKRKANGKKANLFNCSDEEYETSYIKAKKNKLSKRNSFIRYRLGAKYGDTYFTKREADCMVSLLKTKTISCAAALLGISVRTAECYVNQMKAKIGCRTKGELVELVRASEFMKNVNIQK
jgi:DNA-binding CsgD family transcriptional regulator